MLGQEPGEGSGGGAGVDEEGGALAQVEGGQGRAGDAGLGLGVVPLALEDAGLGGGQHGCGQGPAVDLAQGPGAVEDGEVPADGLDGDVVVAGELGDADAALARQGREDPAVTVLCFHSPSLTTSMAHFGDEEHSTVGRAPVRAISYVGSDGNGRGEPMIGHSKCPFGH